jgi:Uma2 family endonuclease
MTSATPSALPLQGLQAGFRRFTIREYHNLIRIGVLTEDDNLELIRGYLVHKMSRNPPHDSTLQRLTWLLPRVVPRDWSLRIQSAATLGESEPEPDGAIVRGGIRAFDSRHPGAADFGIVIEVSDSTLAGDRQDKCEIYAEAGIPEYWIVNLVDNVIEVYTSPSATPDGVRYTDRQNFGPGTQLPLRLDGVHIADIPVDDVLP